MWYKPGDVVSVRVNGIRHEGIITETGRIISNSRRRGGVYEESARTFAGGGKIKNHGPRKSMPPHVAIARARARIGRRYHPYSHNCEHLVREAYGEKRHSPQKRIAMGLGALLAAIAIL